MKRGRSNPTALNNYTIPPIKRIKLDLKAPVRPSSLDGIRLDVQLPVGLVNELKSIRDLTRERFIEFAGVVPLARVENTVFFEPPKRLTNKQRGLVNLTSAITSYMSYHSHPSVSDYFTLPSEADISIYLNHYDKMQVNIIVDNIGYYVIDYIEVSKSAVIRNKALILKKYNELVEKFRPYYKTVKGYIYYTPPNATIWKKYVKNVFSALPGGLSITYYTFKQRAIITLKPPEMTPERQPLIKKTPSVRRVTPRSIKMLPLPSAFAFPPPYLPADIRPGARLLPSPKSIPTTSTRDTPRKSPRKSIIVKSMAKNIKSIARKSAIKSQRNRRDKVIKSKRNST
jgi:hypothetical protein